MASDRANAANYKVNRIRGGAWDGYYEILYKGQRIESGAPFVTRKTAVRLMECEIANHRSIKFFGPFLDQ